MSDGLEIPMYGDGTTERDYTFVADIVDGIEAALDWTVTAEPGSFELINLGESQTTSLARLVELIATELGVEPKIKRLPVQPGDVQRTFADVAKAREVLGYNPSTSMEDGIRRFVEWFRSQPDARSSS
jgi:UDP-glucuronate 4-epimerase